MLNYIQNQIHGSVFQCVFYEQVKIFNQPQVYSDGSKTLTSNMPMLCL